jgi:hypothetical protein
VTSSFGGQGYVNSETRALSSIEESAAPEIGQGQQDQIDMLQRHDYQIKFLAGQVKQAQKGINEATQNPIQQIEQFVADIIVLLGGGEITSGLDLGDLQYFLPALGALFGFDSDEPFPLSLFSAAARFFLGYVVPQQQFVDVINHIIEAWLGLLGIDPDFIHDIQALLTSVGDLFDGIGNLFPTLNELFDALGITAANLGPLGQALRSVLGLFDGINLDGFANIVEFITDAIDPWIEWLTSVINWINSLLAVFGFHGGDVVNSPLPDLLAPFQNLIDMLGGLNFADAAFDAFNAAGEFITNMLEPTGLLAMFGDLQKVIDAITAGFHGLPSPDTLVDGVRDAIAGLLGIGQNAQQTADNGWSQIVAINAILTGLTVGTGTAGSDDFDGPALTNPGPNWGVIHFGGSGGSNDYYRNGAGKLVFPASGILGNACVLVSAGTSFVGPIQTTAVYLPQRIGGFSVRLVLINRFDLAGNIPCVLVSSNTVQAGYIDNTALGFHTLGPPSPYTQADGEYWEFDMGEKDLSNDWMYRVRRNGLQVHTYDDSTSPSTPNTGRGIAVGGISSNNFPAVLVAPTIDTFAWYERA